MILGPDAVKRIADDETVTDPRLQPQPGQH
jgi:hypothetical protein